MINSETPLELPSASWLVAHRRNALGRLEILSGASGIAQRHRESEAKGTSSHEVFFAGELHAPAAPAGTGIARTLLDLWRLRGERFLRDLRGVFSLVIATGDEVLAVRDPMGIAPLYFAEMKHGEGHLFSDSIGVLRDSGLVAMEIDRVALADHLRERWPDPLETFYSKIRRVPRGHLVRIRGGEVSFSCYWDPARPGLEVDWLSERDLERFDEMLDGAVERCLSGSAGIYLSSGIDSVSVAASAVELSKRRGVDPPLALSLSFPHPDCNEEPEQRAVAAGLGLRHVVATFDQALGGRNILEAGVEMSRSWPFPLMNFWLPAYQHLAQEARRRGCRFVLTGGGGDDWLGVSSLYAADLVKAGDFGGLWRLFRSARRSYRLPLHSMTFNLLWTNGVRPLIGAYAGRFLHRNAPEILRRRRMRRIARLTPSWLAPDRSLRAEIDRRVEQVLQEPEVTKFYLRDGRRGLDHPLLSVESEELFEHARRAGLAIRFPYLDADLVDLLYRTPPEHLNRGDRSKALARESIRRRFPQLGIDRQKKVSSSDFFLEIMSEHGLAQLQRIRGPEILADLGVISPQQFLRSMRKAVEEGDRRGLGSLHGVLMVESWLRGVL
ncbi:MAG TPA: asparagine synthase-related protein [Thermoanaerobaculia bacterium]|nr:asparagine synthase-related protein [Thermoanaerobaculia bacterium]